MPFTHAGERRCRVICNAATLIESQEFYRTEHTEEHFYIQLKTCRWHTMQVGCIAHGLHNGAGEGGCGCRADAAHLESSCCRVGASLCLRTQSERENGVAVKHGMSGPDSHCQSVVSHLRNFIHLNFAERGIGGNDGDGRIARWIVKDESACWIAHSGDDLLCLRVEDIAQGIDSDDGTYKRAIGQLRAGRPQSPFH